MERNKFRKAMQLLAESFGSTLTPERVEIYYSHLQHLSDMQLSDCINLITRRENFFPTVSKFFDILQDSIQVPSQSNIHSALTSWMMDSTVRDVKRLSHPIYKMMAEEMGLLDRFVISQIDFDNDIKYKYKRIVEEYRRKMAMGEQLRLPESSDRDLYPYANKKQPKRVDSGFKKLDMGIKQLNRINND